MYFDYDERKYFGVDYETDEEEYWRINKEYLEEEGEEE